MDKSNEMRREAVEISKGMYDMSSAFWRDVLVPIEDCLNPWFSDFLGRLRMARGNQEVVHVEITNGVATREFLIMAVRAGHLLQDRLLKADAEQRRRLVDHMRTFAQDDVGKSPSEFIRRFDSHLYECVVFSRLMLAKFDPEFLPKANGRESPDIKTAKGILVECKNAYADKTKVDDLRSVVNWIAYKVQESRRQMAAQDANGEFTHVTCLDLAPGVFRILEQDLQEGNGEFSRFWDEVFGFDDPDKRLIDPLSVQFSSFDFGLHSDFQIGSTYPEVRERWVRPLVISNLSVRLGGYLNEFWHSMGTAPFGHLHLDEPLVQEVGRGDAPHPT